MRLLTALLLLLLAGDDGTLTAPQREETIRAAAAAVAAGYVDEGIGRRVAQALHTRLAAGEFDRFDDPGAFAAALEGALLSEHADRHFIVWHGPLSGLLKRVPALAGPSVGRTELLPGEIGYVEIRNFLSDDGADFDRAMRTIQKASALVIDLRETPGGNRQPSYFFDKRTPLINVITRGVAGPVEVATLDDIHGTRVPDVPVYVLTSRRTASAGEMLAFALKASHRATIVGEKTAGAGHSVRFTPLPNGFFMLVPVSRNVDPRTGKEWEGEGVAPDVDVTADRAFDAAIERIRK